MSRVVLLVLLLASCAQQSLQGRESVVATIASVQRADYEGDREALRQHLAALALVPYWHYVRDIPLPEIRGSKEGRERAGAG